MLETKCPDVGRSGHWRSLAVCLHQGRAATCRSKFAGLRIHSEGQGFYCRDFILQHPCRSRREVHVAVGAALLALA